MARGRRRSAAMNSRSRSGLLGMLAGLSCVSATAVQQRDPAAPPVETRDLPAATTRILPDSGSPADSRPLEKGGSDAGPVEVENYLGQKPIAHVEWTSSHVQWPLRYPLYPGFPSFEFVVLGDGAVFFEGRWCAAAMGLRASRLTEGELHNFKEVAEMKCGMLTPPGERHVGHSCMHRDSVGCRSPQ
jgi:hypothetical protein